MAVWRQLTADDIPDVMRVAEAVHPGLPEGAEVFAERIALYPDGCFALVDEMGGNLCGYAISHPIKSSHPPSLDTLLGAIAPEANCFYIHDVAVLPQLRGRGLAAICVRQLLPRAGQLGFSRTELIAVYGTAPFWSRFGFLPEQVDDDGLKGKLHEYGTDAAYLASSKGSLRDAD